LKLKGKATEKFIKNVQTTKNYVPKDECTFIIAYGCMIDDHA